MLITAKRTVSLISAMIFMLAALTAFAAVSDTYSGTCGDNLTWTLDGDGVLTISGTGEMKDYGSSGIPWYSYKDGITSAVIKDGVTTITGCAFSGCKSLTSITIPDSVSSIGNSAFYNCTSLTSVTIPDSVTSIGDGAFQDTAYYNDESNWTAGILYIDNALIEADSSAVSGDVVIKKGTKVIAEKAFFGCESLTSVMIPDGVTRIGSYAFYGSRGFTLITIPDSVTTIGDYAFSGCTSLTSVTIPEVVTTIGRYAFDGCTSLADVYYTGSADDWDKISIKRGNEYLTNATIHCNYAPPTPEITSVTASASKDTVTVEAAVENVSTGNVIAVGITADGEATEVTSVTDGKAEITGENIKNVKVFVWESLESMKPLCEAKEAAVE